VDCVSVSKETVVNLVEKIVTLCGEEITGVSDVGPSE